MNSQRAEQGLCNGRASVRRSGLAVPSIDNKTAGGFAAERPASYDTIRYEMLF